MFQCYLMTIARLKATFWGLDVQHFKFSPKIEMSVKHHLRSRTESVHPCFQPCASRLVTNF